MPEAHLRRCLERFACDFYLLCGRRDEPDLDPVSARAPLSHAGAVGLRWSTLGPHHGLTKEPAAQGETARSLPGPHTPLTGSLDTPKATRRGVRARLFPTPSTSGTRRRRIRLFTDRRKDVITTGGDNFASYLGREASPPPTITSPSGGDRPAARALDRGDTAVVVPEPGPRSTG